MLNLRPSADYSSELLNTGGGPELDQRLGLYRVFLKLYDHHRALLDEILNLENTSGLAGVRLGAQHIQAVVEGEQAYLITNLLQGGTRAIVQSEKIWMIGRDRGAALCIQDNCLSRRHAAIQYIDNQGFYLTDLNSTNGSFVNGEPVRQVQLLRDGDQIRLGSLTFTFFICNTVQSAAALPPELEAQIKSLQTQLKADDTPPLSSPPSESPIDSGLSDAAKDTWMFLKNQV